MTDTESLKDAGSPTDSPDAPPANPLAIAINVFAAPSEAFAALQRKPTVLFPLLITIIATVLIYAWYFQTVDYDWYVDDIISRMGNANAEQQEQIRTAMTQQSQTVMTVTSTIGGAISILLVYTLQAGYLALVSALGGDGIRFRQWFSLISWTSLPYLLVVLVMAVNIIMSPNGQLSIYEANSLSLSSLGISGGDSMIMRGILDGTNLPMFWSVALTVMGYHQWLKCSWTKGIAVVLAPYAVILGALAYFALT
ncbi:MAG: hypothetical protein RLZZ385_507 [Pseudomonadota bacterium]|jgi:hypothetical protein